MRLIQPQAESWFEIGQRVSLAFPYEEWREAPWLRNVINDGDEPGRVKAYEIIEEEHAAELATAAEQWLTGIRPSELPHPASYLIALRFATVGHMLMSFDGIFAPPEASLVPNICRKFLIDWWKSFGPVYAVGYSCSEYDIEG